MTESVHITSTEDPPDPDLAELQQRETIIIDPYTVPVRHVGPVGTRELPAQGSGAFATVLSTDMQHILGADLTRKRALLVCAAAWEYSASRTGGGVPIPANAVIDIRHCDSVYAKVTTGTAELSTITEHWAE